MHVARYIKHIFVESYLVLFRHVFLRVFLLFFGERSLLSMLDMLPTQGGMFPDKSYITFDYQ